MMLTWLTSHWKVASIAAGCAGAFLAGWLARGKPPPPSIALNTATTLQTAGTSDIHKTETKGPERIVVTRYVNVPGPERVLTRTVIERGPAQVSTDTSAKTTEQKTEKLDLKQTPASERPGWSVGVSAEDVIQARAVRVELSRRLFGELWLTAAAVPARKEVAAGLRLAW